MRHLQLEQLTEHVSPVRGAVGIVIWKWQPNVPSWHCVAFSSVLPALSKICLFCMGKDGQS